MRRDAVVEVETDRLVPGRFQPRQDFAAEALEGLAARATVGSAE